MTLSKTFAAATLLFLASVGQCASAVARDVEWHVKGPFALQITPYPGYGTETWWAKVVKGPEGNDILVGATETDDIFTHDPESFRIFLEDTQKGNALISSKGPLGFTEDKPEADKAPLWQFEQLTPPSNQTFLVRKGAERSGVYTWSSVKPDGSSLKPIVYYGTENTVGLRLVPADELPGRK